MNKTVNIKDWDKLSKNAKKAVTKIEFTGTKKTKTKKVTLGFATMCKDEEHCIGRTLDAISKHVEYVVVADNGSTDKTFDIVRKFFNKTGLAGSWHIDPWDGYAINKTKMMSYIKGKTDYVLHLDADDFLTGDFSFPINDIGYDTYTMELRRGQLSWKASLIYNNNLTWRFIGTAHTVIAANEVKHPRNKDLSNKDYFIDANGIGSRSFDPKKFWYDGERLTKQFWECLESDPDNLVPRSIFYAGQSYMDYGGEANDLASNKKALQWYKLFMALDPANLWGEERFEAQMRISILLMRLPNAKENIDKIIAEMDKAISMFSDRAEPYYKLGEYLCKEGYHELAYKYLSKGKSISLTDALAKYDLFVLVNCYEMHFTDWLSVACYWTGRTNEGKALLEEGLKDLSQKYQHKHFKNNLEKFNELNA